MLIKLFEQHPIIAVSEAKILGQIKGTILQNNSVAAVFAAFEGEDELYEYTFRNDINKYIQIPIEDLVIGPDAFLIEKASIANIYFAGGQVVERNMGIYTCSGEFVGRVTGVEVGSDYILQGIHCEGNYIESDRIFKMGNIVIIDSDTAPKNFNIDSEDLDANSEALNTESENNKMFLNTEQEERDEEEQVIFEQKISNEDMEEAEDTEREDSFFPLEDSHKELTENQSDAVFSRYRYLLGKKLINSITVADKTYSDDSIITPKLIEEAINNNCILSLIMNAED